MSFLKLLSFGQIERQFETDRIGSDSVIINLLSLRMVFRLTLAGLESFISGTYTSYQGGGGAHCRLFRRNKSFVSRTGMAAPKSWSWSLSEVTLSASDKLSQHGQDNSLDGREEFKESLPSSWLIFWFTIPQGEGGSFRGEVRGPPSISFPGWR